MIVLLRIMCNNAPMSTTDAKCKETLKLLAGGRPPRRIARSKEVHFLPDNSSQLDFQHGAPALLVPKDHQAWQVKAAVELFQAELDQLRAKSSPLGRHGNDPGHILGVLLYASLVGDQYASVVARRLETDHAYRLLSGGRTISATILKDFRRNNMLLLSSCLNRLLEIVYAKGLLNLEETATDSVRLEADVANTSIRTLARSTKMVEELSKKDTSTMSTEQTERHNKRLQGHRDAVEQCTALARTSHARTDPLATLMKFPSGAAKAGHRLSTVVAGKALRYCLSFVLSWEATDKGLLTPILIDLRARLKRIGVPDSVVVKTAVDAGFTDADDLATAVANPFGVHVVLAQATPSSSKNHTGLYPKDRFVLDGNTMTCPAGKQMSGPFSDGQGIIKWLGVGCTQCPLRAECTTNKQRKVRHNPATHNNSEELRERYDSPEGKQLYRGRAPTVESMYSVLEDAMGFRRVSSRHPATVQSEQILKILAYNLTRYWAAIRIFAAESEANQHEPRYMLHVMDISDWPADLIDAVVDFLLALQATHSR